MLFCLKVTIGFLFLYHNSFFLITYAKHFQKLIYLSNCVVSYQLIIVLIIFFGIQKIAQIAWSKTMKLVKRWCWETPNLLFLVPKWKNTLNSQAILARSQQLRHLYSGWVTGRLQCHQSRVKKFCQICSSDECIGTWYHIAACWRLHKDGQIYFKHKNKLSLHWRLYNLW